MWAAPAPQESMVQSAFVAPSQPNTPATFGNFIAEETKQWTEVLRQRKIQAPD
jgi:hypothetical protein